MRALPRPGRRDRSRCRLQELYAYPGRERDGPADDDDRAARLEGDLIDLEPVLRDAVVLALPLQPVCRDDCPGLCSECGARLADDPDHEHEAADPRWAALQGLIDSKTQRRRTMRSQPTEEES